MIHIFTSPRDPSESFLIFIRECSDSTSTATIAQPSDTGIFTKCSTWLGDVVIVTATPSELSLGPIEVIKGSLNIVNNSELSRLEAPDLRTIGGDMTLDTVQILDTVSFPQLSSVGKLLLNALPNLQAMGLDTGIDVSKVDIQNTQIQSLELNVKAADQIIIANNRYITKINLGLTNIGKSLTMEANNPMIAIELPNLSWAYNITIRNVSSISVPNLNYVNGSLGLYGTVMETFEAPSLSVLKGDFEAASNTELVNISMPSLISAGSVHLYNHTHLNTVDFSQLGTIDKNFEIVDGNLTALMIPFLLRNVGGDVNITTANKTFHCDNLDNSKQNNVIQGNYECNGLHAESSTASSIPSSTSSSGSSLVSTLPPSAGLSNGAKAGIGVGAGAGAVALIGVGALLLLRRRKRGPSKKSSVDWEKPEIDGVVVKREMIVELNSDQTGAAEMMTGDEAQELHAEHGMSEVDPATGTRMRLVNGTHELG
ncbi:hypothetical protein BDV96DRAFT_269680 [Lophiotrema nucula]|uniref:Receptor L-domain domain-containing protein n=1 Tax=Lophiotrema nucula TaxID=690887 RepID=A0A6A5ZMW0_9PLEO|nr:hypothetical protein BDV96DRAFT_269680 [Lophiotrema nucula]